MKTIEDFQPLADQVVIEPLRKLEHFETRSAGGLFLPDNPERDKKREVFRLGRVVKCGPGDAVREGSVRSDGSRAAYQAPETACHDCNGSGGFHLKDGSFEGYLDCECCAGTGTLAARWPIHVQAGDIILYERRPWAVIELSGRLFEVLHEEQHIVAVLEDYKGPVEPLAFDPKGADLVV